MSKMTIINLNKYSVMFSSKDLRTTINLEELNVWISKANYLKNEYS